MLRLIKVEKVTTMRSMFPRRRLTFQRKFKPSLSRIPHVGVVWEVTKTPRKPFVLIAVLDANVFRKYKVAATTADVEIATILMENE